MKTAKELFEAVTIHGSSVRVIGCMDLCTPAMMASEQESWGDEDDQKATDFSTSKAWLWGDGVCIGIDSTEELEQYMQATIRRKAPKKAAQVVRADPFAEALAAFQALPASKQAKVLPALKALLEMAEG